MPNDEDGASTILPLMRHSDEERMSPLMRQSLKGRGLSSLLILTECHVV